MEYKGRDPGMNSDNTKIKYLIVLDEYTPRNIYPVNQPHKIRY